jgi:hypothetical protein
VTCASCGATAPAGSRYCPNCAMPFPPGTPPTPASDQGRHRRSRWVKAVVIALVLTSLAAVAVEIALVAGVHKATNDVTNALTPKPGRPSGYHGPSYPGMLVQDHAASGPGEPLVMSGQTLIAGNLVRVASILGPTLCSPVTSTNHSATTVDVGAQLWTLQQPNGVVETFAITGSLHGGQLAPGGTASGTVCFADTGQSGTFVLLWQPPFQIGRGVWLLPL